MGTIAAVFDVDRTLIPATSMESLFVRYLIGRGELSLADLWRYINYYIKNLSDVGSGLNKRNKAIWEDKDLARVQDLARLCFKEKILRRLSVTGREYIERHRSEGHLIVLVSGSLDFLVAMLMEEVRADHMVATQLARQGERLAGRIEGRHPWGDNKARVVEDLAQDLGIDLDLSYAYGDHHQDVPILERVGHPVAVNPTVLLRREAQRRGWPIVGF